MISSIPSSRSFICPSASVILLSIPSSVLFISVCLFFSSSRSLVNICCIFSIFASILFPRSWIIFSIIILNSFPGKLPISTSFSCFSGILSCPFIWDITFCFFTVIIVVLQALSHVWLFATPWTTARQASLSFTISHSLLKLTSMESVTPCNHLILCRPLLLLPSIFPSIRVFSNESVLPVRWPQYWSFIVTSFL